MLSALPYTCASCQTANPPSTIISSSTLANAAPIFPPTVSLFNTISLVPKNCSQPHLSTHSGCDEGRMWSYIYAYIHSSVRFRMPSTRKRPARIGADSQTATPAVRVRRGNADDHERMRQRCLAAAESLFANGGVEAVTMRAVAAKVGVPPMAPYRYFYDKAELLSGLWQSVIRR